MILKSYNNYYDVASKFLSSPLNMVQKHMDQFSLTWLNLLERMFQRYVYMTSRGFVSESIVEHHITAAQKLIDFDKKMAIIEHDWTDKWSLLQDYHMGSKDMIRRNLMFEIQEKLKDIVDSKFDFGLYKELIDRKFSTDGKPWTEMDNIDEAWALTMDYMKNTFQEHSILPLRSKLYFERCESCDIEPRVPYA